MKKNRRYMIRVTRPDGTKFMEECFDFKEAFEVYWRYNLCPGWVSRLYTYVGGGTWQEL